MKKFLEGLEKLDNGLYRIRETIEVNHSSVVKVPIQEEKILVEGRETTPSKIGYRFKVWNSDPSEKGFNYNGRNYSKVVPIALEQNLSTISLMNHPDDDGDVRNICGVARDTKLDNDGWMSTLFIPCGEYGKLISDVIEAGGPISVSSSILGELDDNNYVKPEGMIIERLMDVVISGGASNGLNHYKNKVEFQNDDGSRDTIAEDDIKEMTEKTEIETLTISDNNKSLEEKGEKKMDNKLLESSLTLNVKSMLKDADKTENLYEKKSTLNEALTYANELTDKTLANEIKEKAESVESELKVLSEKGMKTDELSDSVKELTETKKQLEREIKVMQYEKSKLNSQVKTITKMYEDRQYEASADELNKNRKLAKEVCTLKLEAKNLKEESEEKTSKIQKLLRENRMLKSRLEKEVASSNTKVDTEDYAELQEMVENLKNKNTYLKESLQRANSKIRMAESERNSRFQRVQRHIMMENRNRPSLNVKRVEPKKEETNFIVEDEDAKMEKMLNK